MIDAIGAIAFVAGLCLIIAAAAFLGGGPILGPLGPRPRLGWILFGLGFLFTGLSRLLEAPFGSWSFFCGFAFVLWGLWVTGLQLLRR